uniref:Sec1 family domain containing 1 n=1 Tax=Cavia porcellus TaxID=10141 RepID=H0V9L6_CAVPO
MVGGKMAAAASIRERQTVALKRMLNFNVPHVKNSTGEPVWKVLIYDRFGQDIISPLLSVKELRDMGITLHLLLHSDRDPIPDVPAVYFVMPSEENIDRMCQDLRNQLYESYYLNFISAISRSKLEDIANAALAASAVTQVAKVFDQYLNFITLEDDMFVLCNQNKELVSYRAINRPDITDTEMETVMDTISSFLKPCFNLEIISTFVDSLKLYIPSLFIFLMLVYFMNIHFNKNPISWLIFIFKIGAVPIIRCSRGTAAEMVAVKLDKKLRENLRDARNSLFTGDTLGAGQFSFQRPLLVLVDRNVDLATPLHHTWTYQALVHDVLDFHLNRVNLEESLGVENSPAGARPKRKNKKSYDLTPIDKFWQKHKGSPFPEVAESVQQELEYYRAQEDEVKRLKSIMGLEGEDEGAISMISDNTAKLTSAVSSLPELLEKKRLIDLHTNVATAVLEHIKARKLDVYFEYEEKIMSKTTLDKSLLDIISDPDAGTPEDKMRLFLIYYISTHNDTDRLLLIISLFDRAFAKMASAPTSYGSTTTKPMGIFMIYRKMSICLSLDNLKFLKWKNLPVTRILDNLMEMKSNPETDDYRYFDPKMLRGNESSVPRNKNPFQEAIVFVVGGGNYIEYQNLVDYRKGKQGKHVLYGCSELFNATQFMRQLSQLGQK